MGGGHEVFLDVGDVVLSFEDGFELTNVNVSNTCWILRTSASSRTCIISDLACKYLYIAPFFLKGF